MQAGSEAGQYVLQLLAYGWNRAFLAKHSVKDFGQQLAAVRNLLPAKHAAIMSCVGKLLVASAALQGLRYFTAMVQHNLTRQHTELLLLFHWYAFQSKGKIMHLHRNLLCRN